MLHQSTTQSASVTESAYVDHKLDAVEWFDYGEVDRLLGEIEQTPDDARAMAVTVLSSVMCWVFANPNGSVKNAMVRFVAVVAGLRPDLLRDATYRELADELGVSKQALSAASLKFSDAFKIKFARSRPDDARANMSRKAMGHVNYNTKKNHAS